MCHGSASELPGHSRFRSIALVLLVLWAVPDRGAIAADPHLVDQGKSDPRLRGIFAPRGFKVDVVAAEPLAVDPAAMAFDDLGNLLVAEWRPAERTVETWETLTLPEGGATRIRRARKSTTDVVKRLKDSDDDGVYDSAEVVVDGCEMPTAILPWKNSLLLACVGRLEKWSDEDGDGLFETRTVLIDGFAGGDRRGLGGIVLGSDGWVYLASGDEDNRLVGPDGSRVDLARTGGIFRVRPDGSQVQAFAMGLRNPRRGPAFNASLDPFVLDGDSEDGSKFQGVRLIHAVEEGDYGWRLGRGPGATLPDFDRSAVDGERPGKLPVVARLGRGAANGMVAYNANVLPSDLKGALIAPDAARRTVWAFQVEPRGSTYAWKGQATLMTAEDDQFRPVQATVGADGNLYVLDRRGHNPEESPPWGEGKAGRVYRISRDGAPPAASPRPNNWRRVSGASPDDLVFKYLVSDDHLEADRALRELVERGPSAVGPCLGWAGNPAAPLHTRLLGIQGARQHWGDPVEEGMIALLADPTPEIRRLAAQALAWEPKSAEPKLVAKLEPKLDDPDGRVVREVALAIGRHGEPRPRQPAATLLRWLLAHPQADPQARDGVLRALERLGDLGVEEIGLAIRTRRGVERETAVRLFAGLRTAPAAEQLDALVKVQDLSDPERLTLVRMFQDLPATLSVPTQGLAEWVARHPEVDPSVKVAALEACRLASNPASNLVLALLDDDDESVRLVATRLAARSRPPGSLEKLLARLDRKALTSPERLAILRALGGFGAKAFPALDSAYLSAERPEARRLALRSMAGADPSRAIAALESALGGPDPALRAEALAVLGGSAKGAQALGKAYLDRTIGRDSLPSVVRPLRGLDDAESRRLLLAIEDDAIRGSTAIAPGDVRGRIARGADPWLGLGVFFRESSRCATCHQAEGRGIAFGPTFRPVDPAPPADRLAESILRPSKDVAERFATRRVTLKDGRSLVGIVAARDAKSLTIREPGGREARVDPGSIVEELADSASSMPADVALDLTPDEVADVVAFLQSRPALESLKHGPRKLDRVLAIGPFPLGADRARVPLDRVEASRPLAGLDGVPIRWEKVEATGWGTLNLRGELASKPSRAYLAVQAVSTRAQDVALRFGVEGAVRVYLNGSKVAETTEDRPVDLSHAFARPKAGCLATLPDLARLPLKAGSNLLIVALDRSEPGDARALFEIASPEPVELRLPKD